MQIKKPIFYFNKCFNKGEKIKINKKNFIVPKKTVVVDSVMTNDGNYNILGQAFLKKKSWYVYAEINIDEKSYFYKEIINKGKKYDIFPFVKRDFNDNATEIVAGEILYLVAVDME